MGKQQGHGWRAPRDSLSRQHQSPQYFVPAFSVLRPVLPDDAEVLTLLRDSSRVLGRRYTVLPPSKLCLRGVSKATFIASMRQARIRPVPREMRELALGVRDGLSEQVNGFSNQLPLPLGKIGRFGPRKNQLGIVPLGWRGCRARYATQDELGERLALGTIVAENSLSVSAIVSVMGESHSRFDGGNLLETPYIHLASHTGPIVEKELRRAQYAMQTIMPGAVLLDDPIICLTTNIGDAPEIIYTRDHSAAMPDAHVL